MRQIFFTIPFTSIPVYGYGVMMVVGFIAGMYLAQFLARRSKLDPEVFANAAILALVTGVLGARISHVLENIKQYTNPELTFGQNFWNAVNIREGGLTYYGGFLLAFPTLVLYARWKKIPLPVGMDIIAPCLMLGLAFGRIGCYLNGCCYGAACDVSWAPASVVAATEFPYGSDAYTEQFTHNELTMPVPRELIRDHSLLGEYMDHKKLAEIQEPLSLEVFQNVGSESLKKREQIEKESRTPEGARLTIPGQDYTVADLAAKQHANPVHPAEIYSAVTAFLIAAFLVSYFTLPHVPGRVFAAMMVVEGLFRYVLEMLRVEPAVVGRGTRYLGALPPQSLSMVISFILVIGGVVLWYVFGRIAHRGAGTGVIRAHAAPT